MEPSDFDPVQPLDLTETPETGPSGLTDPTNTDQPSPTVESFDTLDQILKDQSDTVVDPTPSITLENTTDSVPEFLHPLNPEPTLTPESKTSPELEPGTSLKMEIEPQDTLSSVQMISESLHATPEYATLSFPFSLQISGVLKPDEREKLLDRIKEAGLDIQPIDLETQFEMGRVLLPQLSEFTAVWIAQSLRDSQAKILLGPSEQIFTSSMQDKRTENTPSQRPTVQIEKTEDSLLRADHIKLHTTNTLPGTSQWSVIDTITVTCTLRAQKVEAIQSPEFDDSLDALKRELKQRAYRKGATSILDFKYQLTALDTPSHYRLFVSGTAIRHKLSQN